MSIEIKIKQFEGPYDLLLNLIKKRELEITKVALSEVTDQYLQYIEQMGTEEKPKEISDFLLVAAKLLLLKSDRIIPGSEEEDEEIEDLQHDLKVYKRFKQAGRRIKDLWGTTSAIYTRKVNLEPPKEFETPENLRVEKLHQNMIKLINELETSQLPVQHKVDESIDLKDKILHIKNRLKKNRKASFFNFLENSNNKTEKIVGFLAILQLAKEQDISLSQKDLFEDILIRKN